MYRKVLIGISTIALLLGMISAGFAEGTDAVPYLRMGAGARPIAMGGAFTSISDDATSTVWNPAGLPCVKDWSFTLYTSKLSFDRKHSFIGVAKGLGNSGTLALAWINAGVDGIEGWDAAGNATETFDYSSNAVSLSYGFAADKLSLGVGAKMLVNNKFSATDFDDGSAGFGGVDLGMIYHECDSTVTFGVAAKNLLGEAPAEVDFGVAFQLLQGNKATLSFDLGREFSKIAESTTFVKLGVEYWLGRALALRAGGTHTGDRRSLYGGFGVKVAGLQFDYAYSPEDDTVNRMGGSTHFMSLSYSY